jgi:hypothetical protein
MPDLHEAPPHVPLEPHFRQLQRVESEVHALALRIETLYGKLDAAIEIRERLAALEARVAPK